MISPPRITFGIIVLNGEPFTRFNLAALYPFAHQIIVVEGAAPSAKDLATQDGHSADGTREVVQQFQRDTDPEQKVLLVTAEDEGHPDGFWTEKDEMSQAYASRATGNYLWQVDMDEFYRAEDMERVINLLYADPDIQAVTFQVRTFWGSLFSRTDGVFLRRDAQNFHRLFAWGPGFRYVTHRPPTVVDAAGQDLRLVKALTGTDMARRGIHLYHYSFLFPFQVRSKLTYYSTLGASLGLGLQRQRQAWHDNFWTLKHPFYIDDTSILGEPSWLVRFSEPHPDAIRQLWTGIEAGAIPAERRRTDDIERLLDTPWYTLAKALLPAAWEPVRWLRAGLRRARRWLGARAA